MAYRLRYQAWVDYVPAGVGLGLQAVTNSNPGANTAGNQQTIAFFNTDTGGSSQLPPTSSTFTSTDVTNLTAAMQADLAAQMNAVLTRVQNFSTGTG